MFSGKLELLTGMHIGGGRASLGYSDAPVVRTPDDRPFIPGSSFKGAFRATVEKLAGSIPGVWTCALTDGTGCVGAPGKTQREFWAKVENLEEEALVAALAAKLCQTCRLFGSPFVASRIEFHDLYPVADGETIVQVRDGVAIDRDSERASDRLKYDFEVVPAGIEFDAKILLDGATTSDLGLTCLGLGEFLAGFGQIGGKRSRGLGKALLKDLEVFVLDLEVADPAERAERLRRYLLGKTPRDKMTPVRGSPEMFVDKAIEELLMAPDHQHAGGR